MATINFLYRSKRESAFLTLRLLYRHLDKDYVFSGKSKIFTTKQFWMNDFKSNSRDVEIKNKKVELKKEMIELEKHLISNFNKVRKEKIDQNWLKDSIDLYYNPNKYKKPVIPNTLIEYIDYYIKLRINEVQPATVTKFNVIKNKMIRFQKSIGRIIKIEEINEEFKMDLWNYYKKERYNQNTASRELDIIKSFCYHAKYLGQKTHSQLDKLKIKKVKVENTYLSFDELDKIEKLDSSQLSESLLNARDWLVISCYLGQRVSDFLNFKKEMIRYEENKNKDLKPLIEFTQKKTKKIMTIPLHPKVIEYLEKRKGDFPKKISDQKYNIKIKEVCRIAGIDELVYGKLQQNISEDTKEKKIRAVYDEYPKYKLITSHIGRRSFATNFYGDYKTNYLKYVTGHTTEQAFLNYIGKSNKDIALELTTYF